MNRDDRVRELFLGAADLDPDRREDYLRRQCPDDPSIRREVASLLSFHDPATITDLPAGDLARDTLERRLAGSDLDARLLPAWQTTRGRRRISLIVLAAALAVATAGGALWSVVRERLAESTSSQLTTARAAGTDRLHDWLETQRRMATEWAAEPEVSAGTSQLVELALGRDVTAEEMFTQPANAELAVALLPLLAQPNVLGANALNREGVIVSYGPNDEAMRGARRISQYGGRFLAEVFLGDSLVTPPFDTRTLVTVPSSRDDSPSPPVIAAEQATRVVAAAPVRNLAGDIIAVLGIRIASVDAMTEALDPSSLPTGSAAYAFDRSGYVVTRLGDADELKGLGLIPDVPEASSVLNLQLRDPGGDLVEGFRADRERSQQPLTRLAASATAGESGVDVDGYRNYRGAWVVGAWSWIDEFGVGVATEIPYGAAYAGLDTIAWAFGIPSALLALLGLYGLATTVSWPWGRRPFVEARRLGRYRLEEQIGEGGMSTVHRASHAMLNRPTAIKMLKADSLSDDDVARFEREVQLVARLNHPNTIQIFDYGQTESGTLFFVMEHVPGLTLSELVREAGPLPPSRAIAILRQVAGSLQEAHNSRIVHRDIKPANVMLCERSDGADIAKVLDFGLARTLEGSTERITQRNMLGGTPAYIAPERIRRPTEVDPRSDIYSFGGVAYFLLTGRAVIEGESPEEVLLRTLNSTPESVSDSTEFDIPSAFDELVAACLAPEPGDRPASMADVTTALEKLALANPWTQENARSWWKDRRRGSVAADRGSG